MSYLSKDKSERKISLKIGNSEIQDHRAMDKRHRPKVKEMT